MVMDSGVMQLFFPFTRVGHFQLYMQTDRRYTSILCPMKIFFFSVIVAGRCHDTGVDVASCVSVE